MKQDYLIDRTKRNKLTITKFLHPPIAIPRQWQHNDLFNR